MQRTKGGKCVACGVAIQWEKDGFGGYKLLRAESSELHDHPRADYIAAIVEADLKRASLFSMIEINDATEASKKEVR